MAFNGTPDASYDELNRSSNQSFVPMLMSNEDFAIFNMVTNYMTYPICFVGIVSCVLSIVVYLSKPMRNSTTNIYLAALNLIELSNVCITLMAETWRLAYGERFLESHDSLIFNVYVGTYIGVAMRRSSYCLSCILSVERLAAVSFPLKSRHLKFVRFPVHTVLITVVVNLAFHVFIALKLKVASYFPADSSTEEKWMFTFTSGYKADKNNRDAWSHASTAFFVYFVLAACLTCNIFIAFTLRRQFKTCRDMIGKQETTMTRKEKEKRTTIIVLVSTCTLVVLALPGNLASTIVQMPNRRNLNLFQTIVRFGNICELISNCCGLFFYIALSSQFRQSFANIFCQTCKKTPARRSDQIIANTNAISTNM